MLSIKLNPYQILVLGFLAIIFTGSALLCTPWAIKNGNSDWLTALFTATSAVCVTGLVVVDTQTHWTLFGQIIIMLLIQIGGLGIMSFATFFALLLGKKIQLSHRILMQEALNKPSVEGVVNVFRHLLMFSFIIELIGTVILVSHWAPTMGMPKAIWFGIFHAISAFNNAGFDLFGNFSSLTGYTNDLVTNLVISGLIITGGLGFIVLHEIYNYRKTKRLSIHSKLVLLSTFMLIVVGTVLIMVSEYNHSLLQLPVEGKIMASFFQSVSPRTAGFNTIDLNSLLLSTQLFIIFLMFVGGSPGSTAGGIKTTTFALLWLAIYAILRGKRDTELFRRSVETEGIFRALAITLLALFFIFLITFLISFSHEIDFFKILFEVVSAMGTVGLSLGLTSDLSEFGRILIIITMFIGRLGPLTVGYAFIYQKRSPDLKYPVTKIMVG